MLMPWARILVGRTVCSIGVSILVRTTCIHVIGALNTICLVRRSWELVVKPAKRFTSLEHGTALLAGSGVESMESRLGRRSSLVTSY